MAATALGNVQTRGRALAPGVPTIVFFSGFPDTFNSFNMITPHWEATHHVVVCIMPDYDKPALSRFFGHSFPSIVEGLRQTLADAHRRGGPITVVGHDWGSYIVQRFAAAHPAMVQRLVLLDVGNGVPTNLPVVLSYQLYLGFVVFVASRIPLLGKFLGLLLMAVFPWKCCGPTPHEYRMPTKPTAVQPFMCYPYWQILTTVLFDKKARPKPQRDIPTLFVYGKRKRAFFHSQKWLAMLDKADGSEHHAFDCGHWIQTQKPDELVALMRRWLGVATASAAANSGGGGDGGHGDSSDDDAPAAPSAAAAAAGANL